MFSKSKINETGAKKPVEPQKTAPKEASKPSPAQDYKAAAPKAKPPASTLSSDLHIEGNLRTSGDINIDGQLDGDIRAHLLTIGEGATVKGEVVADDVVIHGRIVGRVRGLKVRLTSSARVEGDIIHKTIAIESGAHFEGSVQRQDDPLAGAKSGQQKAAAQAQPAPAKQPAQS